MWNPIWIEFENLFSHVQTRYEFHNGVCSVIFGENKTDSGTNNNGAGKSTIFEAIALALIGRSLRDADKESFINDESEGCLIRFYLENNVLKQSLEIERKFYRNKSTKVIVTENGKPNTQLTSVNEANKRVLELLGLTSEDVLRYFLIYQGNPYTFFTAGDAEKKAVLNRITSADMILPIIEDLKKESKKYEKNMREIEVEIEKLEARKETYTEQRQELLEKDTTADEIARLRESIEKLKKDREDRQEDVSQAQEGVLAYEKKLSGLKTEDVSELRKELIKLRKQKDDQDENLSSMRSMLRQMQEELDHVITCPHCHHEFVKESEVEMSLDEIRESIPVVEKEIKDTNKIIDKIKGKIQDVKEKIDNANLIQEKIDKCERMLRRCKKDVEYAEKDVEDYNRRIKKYEADIEELKNRKKDDSAIRSLDEKIAKCDADIVEYGNTYRKISEEKEMSDYWIYYFGKSGFQTYLANRSISLFAGYVNSFLKKLKTDLSVDISGYKILSDGTVREKIETYVLNKGLNAKLLKSKSGGEQGRINLAGILAIHHLINMSTEGRGLNLLVLDEKPEWIDPEGMENVIKTLEGIGITILMTVQNVLSDFNNSYKVFVVKENGISKLL